MDIETVQIPRGSIGFMMLPQEPTIPESARKLWDTWMVLPGDRQWAVSEFCMSPYPITRQQWTKVMGTSPWPEFGTNPKSHAADLLHYPATCVSYEEAAAFCSAISRKGKRYRLPTELEWEYACRAGSNQHAFFWGSNDPEDEDLGREFSVFRPRAAKSTDAFLNRVGTRKPNGFGLYDMVGLVEEFVLDHYQVHPASGKVMHGELPVQALDVLFSQGDRVALKGGGFDSSLGHDCYLNRDFQNPSQGVFNGGFRVVQETATWTPTIIVSQPITPSKSGSASLSKPKAATPRKKYSKGTGLRITVKIKPTTKKFPFTKFDDWVDEQINGGSEQYQTEYESAARGTYVFYGTNVEGVEARFHGMCNDIFPFTFTITAKPVSDKTWKKLSLENEWDL